MPFLLSPFFQHLLTIWVNAKKTKNDLRTTVRKTVLSFLSKFSAETPASLGGRMKAAFVFFWIVKKRIFLKRKPFFHTVINS
jgi:hypothetical protein